MNRKPPEGFAFVDWEDSLGNKYKDTVPMMTLNEMYGNPKIKVTKSIIGGE